MVDTPDENFGFPKPSVDVHEAGLSESTEVKENFGLVQPAGDIYTPPTFVDEIRPILIKTMTENNPGSENYDLAAQIHDLIEGHIAGKLWDHA